VRLHLVRAALVLLAVGIATTACVVRTQPRHRNRAVVVHKHEHGKHKKAKKVKKVKKHKKWRHDD
jgi:hypothetical protein